MNVDTLPWNDHNRFNQTGYSAETVFPLEENYKNKRLYIEDIEKAEVRESHRELFIEELREDAIMDAINDARDMQEEMDKVNEGWL